jgi:hypothetical protein
MGNDEVSMGIAKNFTARVLDVDLLAAIVYGFDLLGGEKNIVVVHARAKRAGLWIVISFLNEKHARFRSSMRLERVRMQSNNSEDTAPLHNEFPDALIARIVEPALGQHDRHAAARL